ncbi:MAG: transcriptional repressor [Ruminiclostridium sp.]|nr:transcriptional repressor [Ruminiclostridium sp.]
MTVQRKLILKIINESEYHLNAEQIYAAAKDEMPGIALATVYNNLKYLSDHQLIRKIGVADSADFYDKSMNPHDHIICDKCGKISDINHGGMKRALERAIGSKITGYELNVHYVCPECKSVN